MKIKGTINAFFSTRGFGFANVPTNGKLISYFIHINDVVSGVPQIGAEILFTPVVGKKGPAAKEVQVIADAPTTPVTPAETSDKAVA
jgi:cold shock CspA family protein